MIIPPDPTPNEEQYEAIYNVWFGWKERTGKIKRPAQKCLWYVYAMSERDALEKAVVEMGRFVRLDNRRSSLVHFPPDFAFVCPRWKDTHCQIKRTVEHEFEDKDEEEWFEQVSQLEPRHHDEMGE